MLLYRTFRQGIRTANKIHSVNGLHQYCSPMKPTAGHSWFAIRPIPPTYPHFTIQNKVPKSPQTQHRPTNYFLSYPFFSASYPEKQGIMSFQFADIKNTTDLCGKKQTQSFSLRSLRIIYHEGLCALCGKLLLPDLDAQMILPAQVRSRRVNRNRDYLTGM